MGCPNGNGIWRDAYIEDVEVKSVPVQNKVKGYSWSIKSVILHVSPPSNLLQIAELLHCQQD